MTPTITPLVSVITPAYNAGRFIARLVACVQQQENVSYEHIIVNDASTDDTADRLQQLAFNDPRIRLINCPKNVGVVMARNLAIKAARGRFLAFLDADDVWLPEKLSRQTDFMLRTHAAISYTDYRFMSEDGRLIGRRICGPRRVGWHMHHMTRYLGCLTVVVDRTQCPDFSFGTVSPKYRAEDFLAWSKLIRQHGYAYRCPHDLARYAVVANSRSSNKAQAARSVWRLYRDIEYLPALQAGFYFVTYAFFASIKGFLCRPYIPTLGVDNSTWSL
jgi:glycosyltransferase involved in cell wall biosynthesis